MKRYVREFANDVLKAPGTHPQFRDKVERTVQFAERGLITDCEAVQSIVDTINNQRIYEIDWLSGR